MTEYYKNLKITKESDGKFVVEIKITEYYSQKITLTADQLEYLISEYRDFKQG